MLNKALIPLLTLSLLSCKGPASKEDKAGSDTGQKIEILVDGTKKTLDPSPILTAAYTGAHFVLGYLSDKDDLQFSISAYMPALQVGSYQVYVCTSPSECGEKVPDNNQFAILGPYPKDPMPPLNLFRSAYTVPKLGLTPLTLIVTSITDEQQAGNPFKTKRVKGKFSGSLADVEQQQGGYDWYIVGKTTRTEGSFDLLCSMR